MESKKLPNSCWRCAFCGRTNPEEFICCRDCSNTAPKHAEYMDRLRAQLAELEKRNAELEERIEIMNQDAAGEGI